MENYELEYSTFIPVEVDTIIRQKAEAENLPLNYASSILFELIIAGERNKERIRQAYYYRRKRELKITSNKYRTVRANFKLTYDDWEYLHDKVTNQEKDRLTTEAIREIIILWLENENWKMEVLSEYE